MTRPLIRSITPKLLLVAAFSSLALPAAASSDDAWKEFVADVQTACLGAGKDMIEDAKAVVDPIGSENYGLAIITGKAKSTGQNGEQRRLSAISASTTRRPRPWNWAVSLPAIR